MQDSLFRQTFLVSGLHSEERDNILLFSLGVTSLCNTNEIRRFWQKTTEENTCIFHDFVS